MAQAWVGKRIAGGPGKRVVLENPRILHAGLATGSADLIGWVPTVITPEMVGETVAVFTSIEVKTGKVAETKDQERWRESVTAAGGIAEVVRDEAELVRALSKTPRRAGR